MTHYTAEQLASFPWIVSTDTLRLEDLLVRYWQTAEQLAQETMLPTSPDGIGWNRWPFSCIDWADAWHELEIGDGFRLHDIGGEYLVFRSV